MQRRNKTLKGTLLGGVGGGKWGEVEGTESQSYRRALKQPTRRRARDLPPPHLHGIVERPAPADLPSTRGTRGGEVNVLEYLLTTDGPMGRIILPAEFREGLSAGSCPDPRSGTMPVCSPPRNLSASTSGCAPHALPGPSRPRLPARYSSREPRTSYPTNRGRITIPRYCGNTHDDATTSSSSGSVPAEIWDAAAWEEYLPRTAESGASSTTPDPGS